MRAIEIPRFRAVSSGARTLTEIIGAESGFLSCVKLHDDLLKKHIYLPLKIRVK